MHARTARIAGLVAALVAAASESFGAPAGVAEQPADKAQADPQRVEVSAPAASDIEQRRRDPVAKTVYGRAELDKYGDLSVSDVLKRLPGVNMQAGSPKLRGLGAGYTLVLINGEPAPPGFSLDNLSPSQVERVELTRGPSAEHSAQAVAGTINIILREAPRQRQRELRTTLGYTALRPVVSANGSWGDRLGALSFTLPLSIYQWRGQADTLGLRQSLDLGAAPQNLRVVGDDRYWGGGFNFGPRLSWKLGEFDSLNWQTFAQDHRYNSRGQSATEVLLGLPPISVDDQTKNSGYWHMLRSNLQWQTRWADGSKLEVKAGGQASASRFTNLTDGLDGAGVKTLARDAEGQTRERGLSSSGKLTRPLGESHTLALGWDMELRRRTEQRSVVENGQQQLLAFDGQLFEAEVLRRAVYVQDEWEVAPRWSTYLGLRAERISTRSAGLDATLNNSSQVITPIWHLNHKLSAGGKDLLRASLTRSYKAPELASLMSRPGLNSSYPATGPNPQIGPDRIGNPALQPELATGLDLALEQYLAQGGLLSIGGFHRSISGLIRNAVTLQTVSWASVPRWLSQPVNLAHARSTGLEVELKGRAEELMPAASWAPKGLSLRGAFSVYRSSVEGLPGPDNRLEQQQPWSASAGFDQVLAPLTWGASLAWTPSYRVQQTEQQGLTQRRVRTLDTYALWAIDRQTSLRLSANNLLADPSVSLIELQPTALSLSPALQSNYNSRSQHRSFNASLQLKF